MYSPIGGEASLEENPMNLVALGGFQIASVKVSNTEGKSLNFPFKSDIATIS